ncbi:hypothetical protein [Streptomyces sp. LN785]|uniref:hypothetical protein n=1 Tax=Streptomyces sp. LN785 TaxID=3112983 RepID=UPI003718E1D6
MALVVLLALLVAWVVTSGGGAGDKDDSRPNGSGPAHSITPGPSGSGPAISQQPGGRDESDDSGGSGDSGSGTDAGSDGSGDGSDGGSGNSGSGPGPVSGGAVGQQVPAGSSIPDCTSSALQLTLRTELTYGPGRKPRFQLIAKNTSSADCKADFGPKSAVLTVTEAAGDEVWSSEDCPRNGAGVLLRVPAGSTIVHTVEWDRKKSAPHCATPPAGTPGPGTYLVEAKSPGEPLQRASFVLAKD